MLSHPSMKLLLNVGPLIGYFVALIVFLFVASIYLWCEFKLLRDARLKLQTDKAALLSAKVMLQKMATKFKAGVAPEEVFADLSHLAENSAIYKRVQTLATHRAKNAISPVDRVALIETESARQQAGTNWPRFWAGAFTFVGLLGTLLGLSIAVFHLIAVVGSAASNSADASGLSKITEGMTATFAGMGGAFLSTALGVFFSVLLSTTISRHEYAVEAFRLDFEEFSHLQLEPFVSRAQIALSEGENGLVVGGVWEEIDEMAPLKALVSRIERASSTFDAIAHSFADSMTKAASGFQVLHGAADATAAGLHNANTVFLGSVRGLDASVQPIARHIGDLQGVLEAQKAAQDGFLSHASQSVARLESSTQAATAAFEKLAQLDTQWQARLDAQSQVLAGGLEGLRATLRGEIKMLSDTLNIKQSELSQKLESLPESVRAATQMVGESQSAQNKMLAQLESLVARLSDYTSQVDETVARHAAAAYAKPLAEFDAKSFEVTRQLSASVSSLQQEIGALKIAIAGSPTGQQLQQGFGSQSQNFDQVSQRLERIQFALQKMEESADVSHSWIFGVDRMLKRF